MNWITYHQMLNRWLAAHPEATSDQIEAQARAIARKLGL